MTRNNGINVDLIVSVFTYEPFVRVDTNEVMDKVPCYQSKHEMLVCFFLLPLGHKLVDADTINSVIQHHQVRTDNNLSRPI